MIKKINISSLFTLFLIIHLLLWTLIPSFTNTNLPLDTIEALAWGSNLDWGYFKHPPMSALIIQIFYHIFGNHDWAYYLLSQIFLLISFIFVWKFAKIFFDNKKLYCFLSVIVLESIIFYNFTTPEFNVYVCQLPFRVLTVYYCWKALNSKNLINWILFGFFSSLGFLTHYSFIFLILGIVIFFIYKVIKEKKLYFNYFLPLIIFLAIISPHLFWLFENNFSTIIYAIKRSSVEQQSFIHHLINPLIFLVKQIGILLPLIIMSYLILSKKKIKVNFKDQKLLFLISINILPFLIIFLVSFLTGAKIRTMWMSTSYLFIGVLFFYFLKNKIDLKKISRLYFILIFFFITLPIAYSYSSIYNDNKRTDYPGKEIAELVQSRWNKNFSNEIEVVVGDEWFGGNLSYNLQSRPKWFYFLDKSYSERNFKGGFIFTQKKNLLTEKMCPGIYGTIKIQAICMIGSK